MHANWTPVVARSWQGRVGCGLLLVALGTACRSDIELRPVAVAAAAPDATVAPSSTVTSVRPSVHQGAAVTPTGVVVPVLGASRAGWVVGTPCGRTATLADVAPLTGTVVLDAGHGGRETGAIGPLGDKESDLNLAVVSYAAEALKAAGIPAIATRTGDYRVPIIGRAAIVRAVKPKAVVSIHHNASPSHLSDTPGTEVFHQAVGASAAESRRLAGLVYEEVTAMLARLEVTEWASTPRPGVKPRPNSDGDDFYGMLRRTHGTPTVLAEIGFVSNQEEERSYADRSVQKAVGEAVARGIVRFLTTSDPGRGFVTPPRLADDGPRGGGTGNCEDPPLS
jgi:N-acetylmuramoyl-L-alanine amidase